MPRLIALSLVSFSRHHLLRRLSDREMQHMQKELAEVEAAPRQIATNIHRCKVMAAKPPPRPGDTRRQR